MSDESYKEDQEASLQKSERHKPHPLGSTPIPIGITISDVSLNRNTLRFTIVKSGSPFGTVQVFFTAYTSHGTPSSEWQFYSGIQSNSIVLYHTFNTSPINPMAFVGILSIEVMQFDNQGNVINGGFGGIGVGSLPGPLTPDENGEAKTKAKKPSHK